MHILVVEDDQRLISLFKLGLEAEGHFVDTVSTKPEAIQAVMNRSYDVIMLDLFLSQGDSLDGLEICRYFRTQKIKTPVLVVTGKDSYDIKQEIFIAGANGFLAKPFSFDVLVRQIQKLGNPKS